MPVRLIICLIDFLLCPPGEEVPVVVVEKEEPDLLDVNCTKEGGTLRMKRKYNSSQCECKI